MAKAFVDTHRLTEDQRIGLIAEAVRQGNVCAVLVDADPKPDGDRILDRYLLKLANLVPGLVVTYRGPGLVPNTRAAKVGPPSIFPPGSTAGIH
jgi:hypothetical protein